METGQYYLHHLSPFLWEFSDGVGIRWYGFAYVMSFVGGQALYRHLSERRLNPIPPEQVADFITWAAVFGVLLGGRVGYMLLYDLPRFISDPLSMARVWEGGMASHGGILGLFFFTLYYARRHAFSWTGIGDSLVAVAPLGLFLVRIANFINGELYGRMSNVPWAVKFPTELRENPALMAGTMFESVQVEALVAQARGGLAGAPELFAVLQRVLPPRHPSQIYEAFFEGAVLFALLWFVRTRLVVPRGVLTGVFFIGYACLRILGEQFREPEDFNFGLPRGVFLSLFLILIGAAFFVWAYRNPEFEEGCRGRKTAES